MSHGSLSPLDIAVFAGYMLVLFGVGVYFTRQQKSIKAYLLAEQNVHWVIVGVSVLAALFSGITYLGAPAETFFNGTGYILVTATLFIATPITIKVFVPFFRKLKLYTAYEYLERRFDRRLQLIASGLLHRPRRLLRRAGDLRSRAGDCRDHRDTVLDIRADNRRDGDDLHHARRHEGRHLDGHDPVRRALRRDRADLRPVHGQGARRAAGGMGSGSADGKTQFFNFSFSPFVRMTFWGRCWADSATRLVQMVTDQISVQRYLTAASLQGMQQGAVAQACPVDPDRVSHLSVRNDDLRLLQGHAQRRCPHSRTLSRSQGSTRTNPELLRDLIARARTRRRPI